MGAKALSVEVEQWSYSCIILQNLHSEGSSPVFYLCWFSS